MKNKKIPVCGNPRCSTSTGVHEGLTFGSGRLSPHGYWEFPCRPCAAHFDAHIEETRESLRQSMLARGELPLNIALYIVDSDWLNLKAWPLAHQDLAELTKDTQEELARYDEQSKGWRRMLRRNGQ